ncbi:MAG: phosphotransferase [Bacilli bacterium]|nr:phosphotransferase [Bacilli bacterium]
MFPGKIEEIVNGIQYTIDDIGRSEDKVFIFEDKYILKISNDKRRLLDEKERIDFLSGCDIPCSRSICYLEEDNKCYYLRTYIKGYSLIDDKFINNPKLLVDILVNIIGILRKLDNFNCPFKSKDNVGNDFVHGDLCLPNIYVDEDNNFAGFIDLDNSGLGDKWYDYSWLLWSLEYNLGTNKYNKLLLDKLNIKFDKEKYDKYIPEDYRK